MSENFEKVKGYIHDLGFEISKEDKAEELVIISDENRGIHQLIIDCEDPILVVEQHIFRVKSESQAMYKTLMQMNRGMVHGAFVVDEAGENVLFRDTLQLENLDLNELEGTINALGLALAENSQKLIDFASD